MASLLSELESRGRINDCSDFSKLDEALKSRPLTFYCGFDPTADSLHVGSMLPLLIMRRLQAAGHRPIVVLGTATGMIGDPSGKSEERQLLSEDVILSNIEGISKQIPAFLSRSGENAYVMVKNDEWISRISCLDFLRDIGKHFSVNAMLSKESVKSRLDNREQGISYTEFSYMLLQAFDFFYLHQNHDCRLQVGGSDQWGNITAGLDLIRRKAARNSAAAYGLTFPLLTTSSGLKFGKTEKGTVWLDPKKTSTYEFYQYWLNTSDADVLRFLHLFTEIEGEELASIEKSLGKEPEKRLAQRRLAFELCSLVHGESEAKKSRDSSSLLFARNCRNLSAKDLLSMHADVPSTCIAHKSLAEGLSILDAIVETRIASSKSDARRLIQGGGIYINESRVKDVHRKIVVSDFVEEKALLLRCGKKKKHLLVVR